MPMQMVVGMRCFRARMMQTTFTMSVRLGISCDLGCLKCVDEGEQDATGDG